MGGSEPRTLQPGARGVGTHPQYARSVIAVDPSGPSLPEAPSLREVLGSSLQAPLELLRRLAGHARHRGQFLQAGAADGLHRTEML
jgi:hypothetical protein